VEENEEKLCACKKKSWAKHGGEQSTSFLFVLMSKDYTIYVVEEGDLTRRAIKVQHL
jgi:hypothetical protein